MLIVNSNFSRFYDLDVLSQTTGINRIPISDITFIEQCMSPGVLMLSQIKCYQHRLDIYIYKKISIYYI